MQVEYTKPETVARVVDCFRSAVAVYVEEHVRGPATGSPKAPLCYEQPPPCADAKSVVGDDPSLSAYDQAVTAL
jgi:hypothetical protein